MQLLIGGCGSTGSSLLRQILNRHPEIYIAPETHVFAKADLYSDFDKNKSKIFKRSFFGLRDSGLQIFTGFDLHQEEFHHVDQSLTEARSFAALTEAIFSPVMQRRGKRYCGEKTPTNVYHFTDAQSAFSDLKCILMMRNPYDTIASLIRRGYSVTHASARYLLSYAFGSRVKENCFILQYEDLVTQPELTLSKLMDFLQLPYTDKMLGVGKSSIDDGTKMAGWQLDESAKISSQAIGGFKKLDQKIQEAVLSSMKHLYLYHEFAQTHGLTVMNYQDLVTRMSYEDRFSGVELKAPPKSEILKIKAARRLKGYPTPFGFFPFAYCT